MRRSGFLGGYGSCERRRESASSNTYEYKGGPSCAIGTLLHRHKGKETIGPFEWTFESHDVASSQ
jgi:hypothetical protein